MQLLYKLALPFVSVEFYPVAKKVQSLSELPDFIITLDTKPRSRGPLTKDPHPDNQYQVGLRFVDQVIPSAMKSATKNVAETTGWAGTSIIANSGVEKLAKEALINSIFFCIETRKLDSEKEGDDVGPDDLRYFNYTIAGLETPKARQRLWEAAFAWSMSHNGVVLRKEEGVPAITGMPRFMPHLNLALSRDVYAILKPAAGAKEVTDINTFVAKAEMFGTDTYLITVTRGGRSSAQRGLFTQFVSKDMLEDAINSKIAELTHGPLGNIYQLTGPIGWEATTAQTIIDRSQPRDEGDGSEE